MHMLCPEYMCMKLKDLPEDFITMYGLSNKANAKGCYVYIQIKKGMYGLL
jgi:hypothetical protein